jgi:flagellar biosynthesis GTPase FlhF
MTTTFSITVANLRLIIVENPNRNSQYQYLMMNHKIHPMSTASTSNQSGQRPRKEAKRVLIAVFGTTGTGKSTLIQKLSGKKLNIGHNLKSCGFILFSYRGGVADKFCIRYTRDRGSELSDRGLSSNIG